MIGDRGEIVRVPFPFTDRAAVKKRPALVLSTRSFNGGSGHTILTMITKRGQSAWPADYDVQLWREAGLKFPSWISLKIFTLENSLSIDKLGALQAPDFIGFETASRPVLW